MEKDSDIRVALPFIVLAVAVAYSNSFSVPFQYDDFLLFNDRSVTSSLSRALENLPLGGRSLVDLTFAIQQAVNGQSVFAYHIVNLFVHIAVVLAFYFLIRELFSTTSGMSDRMSSKAGMIAVSAAGIFALHPVNVQAVTYISQRYSLFAGLFYLSTLLLYLRWRRNGRMTLYVGAILTAIAAVYSKQNTITLPAALLALEFFFLNGKLRDPILWRRLLPFAAIALLIPIRVFLPALGFEMDDMNGRASLGSVAELAGGLTCYLARIRAILYYVRFIFAPNGYSPYHYAEPACSVTDLTVVGGYLLIITLLTVAWRWRKKYPFLSFASFFFLVSPALELAWPDYRLFYDHWAYLPLISASLGTAYSVLLVTDKYPLRFVATGLAIGIFSLGFLTWQRNIVWQSEESLWIDAANKYPGIMIINLHLADIFIRKGDFKQGCRPVYDAYEMDNDDRVVNAMMGECLMHEGKYKEAEEHFKVVVEPGGLSYLKPSALQNLKTLKNLR